MANESNSFVPLHGKLGQGFSTQEIAESYVHPGRRTDGSQSAASWICDLLDLRKFLILCSFCSPHFNHRKHHYRRYYVADETGTTNGYSVNGECYACKKMTTDSGGGTGYISEETYNQVCRDPVEVRRNRRAESRSMSIWQAINRR